MGMSRSDCARRMLATLDRIRQLESNRHKDWFALTTMVATATARLDSDGLWRDRYPDRTCIIKVIYLGLTTACCCWSNLSLPPQCINQAKLDQARKFPFPFPSRREEFRRWKLGYKVTNDFFQLYDLSMVLLDAIALHFCIVRASMLTRWPAAATSIWNFWNQNTN